MSPESWNTACALVAREGWLLDQREWDAWLALYLETAEYWIPCWADEYTLTSDPQSELSLIYYGHRGGLEDRIFRLRTERSLASMPLPRTCHMTTVAQITESEGGTLEVESNWATHSYRLEKQHTFFGQQTHVLKRVEDGYRIARRKIIVANDKIPNVLDIYSV